MVYYYDELKSLGDKAHEWVSSYSFVLTSL